MDVVPEWISGKKIMEEYGKAAIQLGQACYDGVLHAYQADILRPIIDSNKIAKIPIYPPIGVNPLDHIKHGALVEWDWRAEVSERDPSRVHPEALQVSLNWPQEIFDPRTGRITSSTLNTTAKRLSPNFPKSFFKDFADAPDDERKAWVVALYHTPQTHWVKKALRMMKTRFRTHNHNLTDYLEFPFRYEDFKQMKFSLARDRYVITREPYLQQRCPYITIPQGVELRDAALVDNYKSQLGSMLFKEEEVKEWIGLHVPASVPYIVRIRANNMEWIVHLPAPVPDAIQNGIISQTEIPSASLLLNEMLKTKNIPAINKEFKRALDGIEKDPQASLTAACAIIESFCKVYIEENQLKLPKDLAIKPLWTTVAKYLGFDPSRHEDNDQKKILSGLISIVDGIGALRTHAGSAHGRGQNGYQIQPRHARLAVSAAHTLVLFVLESWENK